MDNTIVALRNLYVALGGTASVVENLVIIPDLINAIAELIGISDVSVLPEDQSKTFWGTNVSDMQGTDIAVQNRSITGTLKYVQSGALVTDWKTHHFIALKFADPNGADDIKVGLENLVSLDEDMNAVLAVKSNTQTVKVQSTINGKTKTQIYDLSGLTLADE